MNRRKLILSGAVGLSASAVASAAGARSAPRSTDVGVAAANTKLHFSIRPRARVIVVNDLAGDVDGLFATVHALLSPSIEVRAIIGVGSGHAVSLARETPVEAAARGAEIVRLMGLGDRVRVYEGAAKPLANAATPVRSPGVQVIIDEAMRTDTDLPLYVTVGGGLTEVASALLLEPQIAGKFILMWMGGDAVVPSGGRSLMPGGRLEYNLSIDITAGQVVFGAPSLEIWQIASDAIGFAQVSLAELQVHVAPHGAIGAWLCERLDEHRERHWSAVRLNAGETWTLYDSSLIALSVLTGFAPSGMRPFTYHATGNSLYRELPTPGINANGSYAPAAAGSRPMRAYHQIDGRLVVGDFFAKMALVSA